MRRSSRRGAASCAGPRVRGARPGRTGCRRRSPPATPPAAEATAWGRIVTLYDALLAAQPSPVVAQNRAIAVGFRDGWAAGLAALDALDAPTLNDYYLLPAARADFLRRLGRDDEARHAYLAALDLVPARPERRLLQRRLGELQER